MAMQMRAESKVNACDRDWAENEGVSTASMVQTTRYCSPRPIFSTIRGCLEWFRSTQSACLNCSQWPVRTAVSFKAQARTWIEVLEG